MKWTFSHTLEFRDIFILIEIFCLCFFPVLGGETGEEDDELSSDSTRMISMDVNGPGGMGPQGSQQQQQQMHQNAQMMHMSSGGSGSGDDSKKKSESQR